MENNYISEIEYFIYILYYRKIKNEKLKDNMIENNQEYGKLYE